MKENFKLPEMTWERCLVIIIIRDVHCPCKVYVPNDAQNQNSSSKRLEPSLIRPRHIRKLYLLGDGKLMGETRYCNCAA